MTKIVLYPTPVTLSKSVLWYISKEREKRKEKKERKKGRKKERKKEAAHIIKKYISRAKLVKLKVPVIIQDPESSLIEAIVWNYTVREENKVQIVAFT